MLRIGSIQVDILKRLSVLYPPPVILCGVSGRCDGMCYKYRHVYQEKKYKSIYMYICICTIYIYTYIYICVYIYIYIQILKSQILQKRPIFLGIFLYIHILLFFFKFVLSTKKIDDFRKLASINSDLGHLIYPSIYLSIYLC